MNNTELQELLRRLGKERQEDAMKAWLTLKVQQQRN